MDDEISVPGFGWGRGSALPRVASGYCAEQRDANLRGVDQPRPRSYADCDTAADVRVTSGTVSEGEEFTQASNGVQESEEAVLGTAPLGEGLLGGVEWQCDR